MKGILFPSSNVVFFAQSDNPNDVAPAKDPAMAINPLASSYGKWEAVENASLAIVEAAKSSRFPDASVPTACRFPSPTRIGRSWSRDSGTLG